MLFVLVVVLLVLAVAVSPYGGVGNYGWWPSGLGGLLALALLVMLLTGRI